MKKIILFLTMLVFYFNHIQAQTQLLNNTAFSSSSSWTTSGVYTYNSVYSSYHSATAYAYMDAGGGSAGNNTVGDLTQASIFVPTNTTALTLSFWRFIGTLESPTATIAYDQLHVTLSNGSFTDYIDYSNMNWTSGYVQETITITGFANYVGTYVTLNFHGSEDASNPTQFRIDDVSLMATVSSCTPASISSQPSNQSSTTGNTATFNITANGTSPITYQWYKNSNLISGANSSSYTTPTLTISDNGNTYYCKVTNCSGTTVINSNSASLTVTSSCTGASITAQPTNQSATTGNTASFNVTANGTAPITYQWYKNSNLISGANSSSYTTPTLTISDNGNTYYCKVTNCSGTTIINSNSATLTVTSSCTGVSITTQPVSQSATTGNTAIFSVNTNGTSPITYQWYKNSNLISGANSASYTTPILTISDNGNSYYCKVTNCSGTTIVNSNSATLTVTSSSTLAITGSLPSPLTGTKLVTYFTFNASITGYSASAQVYVDFYTPSSAGPYSFLMNNIGFGSYSYTKQMLMDGTYTFQYRVVDGTQVLSTSTYSLVVTPQVNNTPVTLDPILSHLVWPFPSSNWSNSMSDPIRDGWNGGEEGGSGCGHNCYGHTGLDYYADDWNKGSGQDDCNKDFLSPLTGTVIFVKNSCTATCHNSSGSSCSGSGNRVIIQSDVDNNYAFMVLHLNTVNVSVGNVVTIGQVLGQVGATGKAEWSHAHCSLYRNINNNYIGSSTYKQTLENGGFLSTSIGYNGNDVSTPFVFDAMPGNAGGIPNNQPILELYQTIFNCNNASLILTAGTGNSFSWNTGDTTNSITITQPLNYSVTYFDTVGLGTVIKHFNVQDPEIILNQFPHKEYLYICDSLPTNIAPVYFDTTKLMEGVPMLDFSFSWNTGPITSNIIVSQPDTFYVTITDNTLPCNNSFVDTIIVLNANSPIKPTIQNNSGNLATNTYTNCTYQWFYNGVPIDSTNSQFHFADSIGYYSVSVTNIYGCSSLSDPIYISSPASINDMNKELNFLYPNPTSNVVFLQLNSQIINPIKIKIFNVVGELVYNTEFKPSTKSFDVSQLSNGTYIIELEIDNTKLKNKLTILK